MKLIGKNSLSRLLVHGCFIAFALQLLNLGYAAFAYFSGAIGIKQIEIPLKGGALVASANFANLGMALFYLAFYAVFTFFLCKIFHGMSSEITFNQEVITWLKRFALLNVLAVPLLLLLGFLQFQDEAYARNDSYILLHLVLGIVIYFMLAYFKEGYELQSQTELTI